jgi:hypothetical protein
MSQCHEGPPYSSDAHKRGGRAPSLGGPVALPCAHLLDQAAPRQSRAARAPRWRRQGVALAAAGLTLILSTCAVLATFFLSGAAIRSSAWVRLLAASHDGAASTTPTEGPPSPPSSASTNATLHAPFAVPGSPPAYWQPAQPHLHAFPFAYEAYACPCPADAQQRQAASKPSSRAEDGDQLLPRPVRIAPVPGAQAREPHTLTSRSPWPHQQRAPLTAIVPRDLSTSALALLPWPDDPWLWIQCSNLMPPKRGAAQT